MLRVIQRLFDGIWIVIGMIIGLILLRSFSPGHASPENDPTDIVAASGQQSLISAGLQNSRHNAITTAVGTSKPAVVGINVVQVERWIERSPFHNDPFWGGLFPDRVVEHPVENLGSGFIISNDGYVITNEHVVHNAEKILVTLTDGRQVDAVIVGADYNSDIALLDLEGEGFPHLEMGDSDEVLIGEWAIALGNPFGLFANSEPSVTVGVVSAVNRDFGAQDDERVYINMLQTDAAINPGNSGGPLLNSIGQVIAMNTMIYSRGGGSVGLGFAIPVNRIREIVGDLLTHGHVDRDIWTGIWIRDFNKRSAGYFGYTGEGGVIIVEIDPGSPAENAGLRKNDILININGRQVKDSRYVKKIIMDTDIKVGDLMTLEVFRNSRILEVRMKAAARLDK
jgi:serine protease Do